MSFWTGLGVIVGLELRQRVRGVAWYVLLGIFVVLVGVVTLLLGLATSAFDGSGGWLFSTIIYFVLLLGSLVAPALSGNAINGEREAGTLATTQVTLVRTGQLVLGKFLAAWITALAFLVASVPFLLVAALLGGLSLDTILASTAVLAVELGVIAAIGVGLSGIIARPLFSVVVTYLAVAALSIGTLIAFTLGGIATQSEAHSTNRTIVYSQTEDPNELECGPAETYTYSVPRFDYYWPILAANPYVVLADAVPPHFDANGNPEDLFVGISYLVREAQVPPDLDAEFDACTNSDFDYRTPEDKYEGAVPSWFVGLGIHVLLAAGALFWAWARTRTPAGRLPKGSRVA
ncbi:ABC transporter permease [Compostimonas suwonensis]|uniref:ABC-type transport system involved in multi-copper enzyme maturation permease subunit n=1 Tax=Compostimonas suwonensis TaxID=1048394 RepID=A0A2M9BW30_9MICO|nr:ABC transporter permease [Compostimonas suwonensis]PJJ62158.1 ABC-type transport system involved in multi-copper enzyme maturation permease subunit [Compostimonas suwonensis]